MQPFICSFGANGVLLSIRQYAPQRRLSWSLLGVGVEVHDGKRVTHARTCDLMPKFTNQSDRYDTDLAKSVLPTLLQRGNCVATMPSASAILATSQQCSRNTACASLISRLLKMLLAELSWSSDHRLRQGVVPPTRRPVMWP